MKTFRMIGMALMAVLACVNLTSCEKDEDLTKGEDGIVTSGKRLVKMVEAWEGESDLVYTFTYDEKGRLIEAALDDFVDKFTWSDNKIVCTVNNDYTRTLILENGFVQTVNPYSAVYTYNSSNRLIDVEDIDGYGISATWDNDKLVSVTDYGVSHTEKGGYTLTYATSCKKGYSPYIALVMEGMSACPTLFMAHPELAGIRTTQLPANSTYKDNGTSFTDTYTYELDKDGYISKIHLQQGEYKGTTTLTWE